MPAILRSLSLVLGTAGSVFGLSSPVARGYQLGMSAACSNPQLSCHNTSAVSNLCCFNAPGGALLQTQFWDANPSSGPSDSWTIHGLWPDNCDGTYEANCDSSRAYTNITAILQAAGEQDLLNYMTKYWTSIDGTVETFWEHEWGKHGTCISTLDPDCYTNYQPTDEVPGFFNRTVSLFQSLPSYDWLSQAGIVPSASATYTSAQIQAALSKNRGGHQVYLGCSSGALNEIWYFFNVLGSVQTGTFEAADPIGSSSTCPSSGIKYLPKSSSGSSSSTTVKPSSTSVTSSAPTSTSTGVFSGSGYLNVISGGSQDGCIVSAGTWYTSGTCATFTASTSGSGFTLTSSKGKCAVQSGLLTCASSVSTATIFSADGGNLVYSGSDAFSSDSVPSGTTQAQVYSGSGHSAAITIEWQSK